MLRFNDISPSSCVSISMIQIHLMLRFNKWTDDEGNTYHREFKYISCYGLILVFPCPSQFNIPQKPLFFNKFAKIYQPVFIFSYFFYLSDAFTYYLSFCSDRYAHRSLADIRRTAPQQKQFFQKYPKFCLFFSFPCV